MRVVQLVMTKPSRRSHFFTVLAYTFILLVAQVQWVSVFPIQAFRIDLFLPLMLGVAMVWPPFASLFWALFWGFALDVLSGKFWGFHVASYVVTCCLVTIAMDRLEFANPLYYLTFAAVCALGQSLALGFYLSLESADLNASAMLWWNLLVRAGAGTVSSLLVLYPLLRMTGRDI